MNNSIKYIALEELADFVRGPFGGSLKKNDFVEEGYAVYEQQHAINNQFNDIRYFIDEDKFASMKRFEVNENDLIMSCSGTMGKVAVVPKGIKKGIINQALLKITPSRKLNVRFLEYYMQSSTFQFFLNKGAKGAAIKNVASVKELKKIPFPDFDFNEQQKIVEKLDKAFELIDQAKANIEQNIINAKELFQSKLDEVFSVKNGNVFKLGDLGKITSSKRIYKNEYVNEGIPFYRTKEIKELANSEEISLELFISREKYYEIKSKFGVPQIGDILISAVGTIGEIYVIDDSNEFYFKDGNIIWLKGFNNINSHYLKYLLKSIVNDIKKLAHGSAYSALTIEKLVNVEVNLPDSLNVQEEIVKVLDETASLTDSLISKYLEKLSNLEELRKSILEKAFKGELTN